MRWRELTENDELVTEIYRSLPNHETNADNDRLMSGRWPTRKPNFRPWITFQWRGETLTILKPKQASVDFAVYVVDQNDEALACIDLVRTSPNIFMTYDTHIRTLSTGQGLGFAIYHALMDAGLTLQSGESQTTGAEALWKKLVADPSVKHSIQDDLGDSSPDYNIDDAYSKPDASIIIWKDKSLRETEEMLDEVIAVSDMVPDTQINFRNIFRAYINGFHTD